MRTFLKSAFYLIFAVFSGVLAYAGNGYYDSSKDAVALKKRASGLISQNRGSAVLGSERVSILLQVQDPRFYHHQGVDLKTAGAGLTTITQSLSKRLAFNDFKPGIRKIRQTAYAMGLDKYLSKEEVLTLFINTVPMGHSDDGWVVGLFRDVWLKGCKLLPAVGA